jgi:hypothetical protein
MRLVRFHYSRKSIDRFCSNAIEAQFNKQGISTAITDVQLPSLCLVSSRMTLHLMNWAALWRFVTTPATLVCLPVHSFCTGLYAEDLSFRNPDIKIKGQGKCVDFLRARMYVGLGFQKKNRYVIWLTIWRTGLFEKHILFPRERMADRATRSNTTVASQRKSTTISDDYNDTGLLLFIPALNPSL